MAMSECEYADGTFDLQADELGGMKSWFEDTPSNRKKLISQLEQAIKRLRLIGQR